MQDKEPLIHKFNGSNDLDSQKVKFSANKIGFEHFNLKEESTVIAELIMLKFSPVKSYLLLPILSLLTLFVLPIWIYWS
jgi:hypothetical protein